MTALVEFEHVTKQYGNQKALNDLSFTIEPGKNLWSVRTKWQREIHHY